LRENRAWGPRGTDDQDLGAGYLAWALLGLAAAITACYWPLIARQWSLQGDYASYYYPFAQFSAASLARGELPLWNPFLIQGYHYLANPQTQVFYPPAWLLALFVQNGRLPYYLVELFTLGHLLLAGLFVYLYVRRLGAPATAAFFSGLVFATMGFMWAQLTHKAMVETVAWLPAVLFALESLLRRPSLKWALLTALAAALMFLGGFVPYFYLCAPFLAVYALLGLLRQGRDAVGMGPRLGYLILAGALAGGLAAVQILPTLELAGLTYRQVYDLTTAARTSLWPGYLLSALAPMLYFQSTGYSMEELHFFLGLSTLLLAGVALAPPWRRGAWFWSGAAAVALLVALGLHTPLYGLLWNNLPGMNVTRVPGRYVVMVDLGLAVLAGLGAARLLERKRGRRAVPLGLLGLYLALGLAGLWARWGMQAPDFDPAAWGLAPDVTEQTTRALVVWFLGLAALALSLVEGLPRGLAVAALTALALAEALAFPRQVMWGERAPETYFPVTANVALLKDKIPPGRVAIDRQLAFADRYEQNAGAVYRLPTTAVLDTVGEARLWNFAGLEEARLTADLLDARFLSTGKDGGELPQARVGTCEAWPGHPVRLGLEAPTRASRLGLVSSLAFAEAAAAGEPVAEIVLRAAGETMARLTVRAGEESAEWSVDNPGRSMAHGRTATLERSWAMAGEDYQGHVYRASWDLAAAAPVEEVEIRSLHPTAVLRVEKLELDGLDLLSQGPRYVPGRKNLFRNRYALPRARLLRAWRVAPAEADTLRAIRAADLAREVVLEKEPVFPAPGEDDQPAAADRVDIVEDGLNRVTLEVAAKAPAILFLADTHYPGWRVMVDARPAELLRADYCLRAVALGPGSHRVEFVFRPTHWGLAWGTSLASLGLLALMGILAWLGGRPRRNMF
jgi:hypothetical protein